MLKQIQGLNVKSIILNKLVLQAVTSLNKSPPSIAEVDQHCDDKAQEEGEHRDERRE